jgi:osmotically-inducible protein OsmY
MLIMKPIIGCIALALVCACSNSTSDTYAAGSPAKASPTPAGGVTPSEPGTKTKKAATDQHNDKADLELASQIRRKLMDDAVLSTKSKNAVIVVENGRVTLSGAVPSESEKERIAALAGRVVGDDHVDNQIEVKP